MYVCGKQAYEAESQLTWYALLHVLHTALWLQQLLLTSGTPCRAQTVVKVRYTAREGEPSMPPGSDVCQIMPTSDDATLYQRVVSQVSKMFAEVLADADWVLKCPDGQLITAVALSGSESWSWSSK